jgi:hypothetical protein
MVVGFIGEEPKALSECHTGHTTSSADGWLASFMHVCHDRDESLFL